MSDARIYLPRDSARPCAASDGSSTTLRGRRSERAVLDGLLEGVRGGRTGVLVLRGEAGAGKTALLDYAVASAAGLRVVRAAGVESERELAYAGLHQLCGPVLDRLERLPEPQRAALGTAFGLEAGPAPDRFLVGLAVLSLLSEAAAEGPLVCVVDDSQWLDQASAQVLGFAARRLAAKSVLVLFAAREPDTDLHGLPELVVEGLRAADARELLDATVRWPIDERVREQIVAETREPASAARAAARAVAGRAGGQLPAARGAGAARPDRAGLPAPGRGPAWADPAAACGRGGRADR